MKEQIDAERFRRDFKQLDDAVLLSAGHFAALTGQTESAIYVMKFRGQLPLPAINRRRLVRWTAGQIRAWTSELIKPNGALGMRSQAISVGRPRQATSKIERSATVAAVDQFEV